MFQKRIEAANMTKRECGGCGHGEPLNLICGLSFPNPDPGIVSFGRGNDFY